MKLKVITVCLVVFISFINYSQKIENGAMSSYERTEKDKIELVLSVGNAKNEIITITKESIKGPGSYLYFLRKESADHKLIYQKNITSELIVKGGAVEQVLLGKNEIIFVLSEIIKKAQLFQVKKFDLNTEVFSKKVQISERERSKSTRKYHVGASISPNKERIFVGVVPSFVKNAEVYKEYVLLDNDLKTLWQSNGGYFASEREVSGVTKSFMSRTELNFNPQYVVNNSGVVYSESYEFISAISEDGAIHKRIKPFDDKDNYFAYYKLGINSKGQAILAGGNVDYDASSNLTIGYKLYSQELEIVKTVVAPLKTNLTSRGYSLLTKSIELEETGEITLVSYLFMLDAIPLGNGGTRYIQDFDNIYVTKFDNSDKVKYNSMIRRSLRTDMRKYAWLYYKKDGVRSFIYEDPIENRGLKSDANYVPMKGKKKGEIIKVTMSAEGKVERHSFFDYRALGIKSLDILSVLTSIERGLIMTKSKKEGCHIIYCE